MAKGFQLKDLNTFGVEAEASSLINLYSVNEAIDLFKSKKLDIAKTMILGGGSNLLFTKDYAGTLLHPHFNSIEIIARGEKSVFIAAEAGVVWDDLVSWSVENNFGGLENLSYIPGSVGAAPIQNIGAYGVEISDTIVKVRAIRLSDGTLMEFSNEECKFGYRSSIFKNELKGQFLISSIIMELDRDPDRFKLSYGDIESRIEEYGELNLQNVRQAIIKIRKEKLPEPSELGNAGSFFKNPYINREQLQYIETEYPELPSWPMDNNLFKIPAAWLIEKAGWKGYRSGDAGVHHRQALVLVNYGKASGNEILNLSQKIVKSVTEKFGISLEYEVNII